MPEGDLTKDGKLQPDWETGYVSESSETLDLGTAGDPMPDLFAVGTAAPPIGYEPDFTAQTGPPDGEFDATAKIVVEVIEPELTPPELVTQVMADVQSIKDLKIELALKLGRVRDIQRRLIDHGMVMDFPVLNEVTLGAPVNAAYGESNSLVIGEAVVPARSDEEVRNAPMELDQEYAPEQLNEGAPVKPSAPDKRDERQVAADSFINPTQGQVDQFQMAVEVGYENAVQNAFKDSEKKVEAANKRALGGGGGGGMGWMNPFNNV